MEVRLAIEAMNPKTNELRWTVYCDLENTEQILRNIKNAEKDKFSKLKRFYLADNYGREVNISIK